MKIFKFTIILLGLSLFSCNQSSKKNILVPDDKMQIENLVITVYKWHDSDTSKNDMAMITDQKDSVYIGIDLEKHKLRLIELKKTNFFSDEFIENYNKIVLTIEKKLKNKEFEWNVGELPPFGSDTNPWCNCQDYPDANPWDKIEFKFISLDKENATLTWTWGNPEWSKDFNYKVQSKKINGTWQIVYLQGFDFDESTRKNY